MRVLPPDSEAVLMERAINLAGKTLQQIANLQQTALPEQLTGGKGHIGELLEDYLGASAGSLPEPDFRLIGVELKTLPIGQNGNPKESTFVCTVSLLPGDSPRWEDSLVKRKLSRVLWVPIEADAGIPLAQRRIGNPFLWSPSPTQEKILHQDWDELMNMVMMGELEKITAMYGKYLQIRPKAKNAKSLRSGINADGDIVKTLPRGFYLRTSFTKTILADSHAA
jgi:DNA mismatch repair protein MutH